MAKEKIHLPLKEMSTYVYLRTLIAREKKSMPDFKTSKTGWLLWGANTAAVLKLKTMFIYWFESSRALKNYAKSPLCILCKSNNKAWMTADLFTIWLTEYFKPTVETWTERKKKEYFWIITADWQCTCHARALMELYNKINFVIMSANTTSTLWPMHQWIISSLII